MKWPARFIANSKPIEIAKTPFEAIPAEEQGARKPVWVQPKMVVEVDFRGWTHGDRVRQASFQGVREDKAAKDVVREQAIAATSRTTGVRRSAPVKNSDVSVAGVHLTHPDRIYWDDVGITKRDLADFYVQIWKWMRPHLVGRPISLLRCPEGRIRTMLFSKACACRHSSRASSSRTGKKRQDYFCRRYRWRDRVGAGRCT